MPLEIQADDVPGAVRMALSGELDATTAPEFEAALAAAVSESTRTLIVDLDALTFVSSAGLRVFAKAQKTMKAQNGKSYFVRPTPQVKRVFEFVQAVKLADVFDSDADLDRHLETMQNTVGL